MARKNPTEVPSKMKSMSKAEMLKEEASEHKMTMPRKGKKSSRGKC